MTDIIKNMMDQADKDYEQIRQLVDELAQGIKLINDMRDEIYKLADFNEPIYAENQTVMVYELLRRLDKIKGLCKRYTPEKPTA